MQALRRTIGVAQILVSLVVAVQFIAWRLYDSGDVWAILDYVMFVAILLAFYFNLERKRKSDASGESGITRVSIATIELLNRTWRRGVFRIMIIDGSYWGVLVEGATGVVPVQLVESAGEWREAGRRRGDA